VCILPWTQETEINIKLVSKHILNVSGDRFIGKTKVRTKMGNFHSDQEFIVLDYDVEDLVISSSSQLCPQW